MVAIEKRENQLQLCLFFIIVQFHNRLTLSYNKKPTVGVIKKVRVLCVSFCIIHNSHFAKYLCTFLKHIFFTLTEVDIYINGVSEYIFSNFKWQ